MVDCLLRDKGKHIMFSRQSRKFSADPTSQNDSFVLGVGQTPSQRGFARLIDFVVTPFKDHLQDYSAAPDHRRMDEVSAKSLLASRGRGSISDK